MRSRSSLRGLGLIGVLMVAACGGQATPAWSFATGPSAGVPVAASPGTPVTLPASLPAWPSLSAASAPAGALAHYAQEGLAFDYPAEWHAAYPAFDMHYSRIIGFVGTGTATAACSTTTDSTGTMTQCGPDIRLGAGQLMLEVSNVFGPPQPTPIDPTNPAQLDGNGRFLTVGGLPAIVAPQSTVDMEADEVWSWVLSKPESIEGRYWLEARLRGPGLEAMRAQLDAIVASVRYDPPVPVLNPGDGAAMLRAALGQLQQNDSRYRCFPSTPGTTAKATIRELPGLSPLTRDLAVTCSSSIEPTALGLWKAVLLVEWPKTTDHDAGRLGQILWVTADGNPGAMTGLPGSSEQIPYWN